MTLKHQIKKVFIGILSLTTILLVACTPTNGDDILKERFEGKDYGVDLFSKLDRLAETKDNLLVEQQSSYSRDGGNSDGFGVSGNITGEPDGRGNPLIRNLLELKQPGVVYRMWFTHFGDVPNLRIYIDGELIVDENLVTLSSGTFKPFVKPLVQNQQESSGGFVFYVPIPFKESIRIVGSGNFYYNINYVKLPADTEVESFSLDMDLGNAVKILENVGNDPKYRGDYIEKTKTVNLDTNKETTVFEFDGRQTVSSLNLKVPAVEARTYDRSLITDQGTRLANRQALTFDMDVKSDGVQKLRFRTVILSQDQIFNVMVEGQSIGDVRVRPRRLEGFEWKDNPYWYDVEITVPNHVIGNKTNVDVRVESKNTVTIYSIWSVYNDKIEDVIQMHSERSRNDHNLKSPSGFTPETLEYDPNLLIDQETWKTIFEQEDLINNVWLNVYYDGKSTPDVSAPVSSFFGFGEFGAFETISLMVGLNADGTMYSYYPMPFEKSIKITLTNKNSTALKDVEFTTNHEPNIHESNNYGYFKTEYKAHVSGTSTALQRGLPMTFLKVSGSGHIVGVTHSMTGNYFGEHSRFYLEGDEQIYIDGSISHSYHGTGTEDFYNGAWYFNNGVQVTPLYGVGAHNYRGINPAEYETNINRTVMLRTLVTDPIIFRDGIDFKMEHGGSNDRPDSSAYILTYYYHNESSKLEKTDEFNFYDDSYLDHNYKQDDNSKMTSINGRYEGIYRQITAQQTQKIDVHTFTEFTVAIKPENEGVILRWLLDLSVLDQEGILYVDGTKVTTFSNPFRSASFNYVRTTDLFIPKQYTTGKSTITIRLENTAYNPSTTPLTQLGYTVHTLLK